MKRAILILGVLLVAGVAYSRTFVEAGLHNIQIVLKLDPDGTPTVTASFESVDANGSRIGSDSVNLLSRLSGPEKTALRQCANVLIRETYGAVAVPTPTPSPVPTP